MIYPYHSDRRITPPVAAPAALSGRFNDKKMDDAMKREIS